MNDIPLAISIINGTALLIGVAMFFGYRWVDSHFDKRPIDPNKPLKRDPQ